MKAKIESRNENNNREELHKKIPLTTPMIIEVDVCNLCNFKCNFCPCNDMTYMKQSRIRRGKMSNELFEKIIRDIHDFEQPIKVMRFHKQGEPLLNENLPNMIRMAKQSKRILTAEFTTNAYLLNKDLIKDLIGAGLDKIVISIEALSTEGYRKIANVNLEYQDIVKKVRLLNDNKGDCEVCIKIGDIAIESNDDETTFYNTFGDMCDRIFIDRILPVWPEHNVECNISDKGVYGNVVEEKLVCPYIFYTMAINSDGSVNPCCVDWKNKLLMGDANTETLKEIWDGKAYRDLQLQHLEGKKNNISLCNSCGLLTYATIDNIDKYRNEILNNIKMRV